MMDREQIIHFAMVSGLYDTLQDGMPGAAQWIGLEEELEAFAKLVAEQAMKYGPSYQVGYADGAFEERQACAAMVKPLDESLADEILARGNN
jgi:hypothetical protein